MEIIEYRKNDDPVRKGYFDVKMPNGFILRNFCLFEKNGKQWVNIPSRKDGDNWIEYFSFESKKDTESLKDKAKSALKQYLNHG